MIQDHSESSDTMHRIHRNPALAAALALGLAACGFSLDASAASLEKISGFVPGYFSSTQTTDMPIADFDGDGLADIVVLGNRNYSDVIQIVGVQGGGWTIKQAIVPETGNYYSGAPNIATWTDAGGAHLLYVQGNSISEYGGWPLTLERHIELVAYTEFTDALVADVDNDGVFELIASSNYSNQAIQAYSLTTGASLWQVATPSNYYARLHVAQLDADPALEILLTGMPGTVIDGATHAIEWQYKDGFGPLVEHGRFGGTSPRFASLGSRLVMFQSQPWSPLWDLDNVYARSSTVADVDGDQIDELICSSDSFPRTVLVMDVQAQAIRSSFEENSAIQVAAADFDGDLSIEIAIGRSPYYSQAGEKSFRVINATSGLEEFAIPARAPGPFVAGGFVANAGAIDLIIGSGSETGLAGTIARVDAGSGSVQWSTSDNDQALNLVSVRNLLVASFPGQSQPTILASGRGNYPNYNEIVAMRSGDGGVLWRINSSNSPLPEYASIDALAAIDLNADAQGDAVLVCTSEPRLRLFNAANQAQLWSSVAMSGECRGAMQVTTNGNLQLVAVLSGAVRAYDAQTHLLSWSLPYPNGLAGATYLPRGASGPEFALFGAYGITFFDAETRSMLRELSFPDQPPIQAVTQVPGASIHDLAVSFDGKLHAVDGVSGTIGAISQPLGMNAGQFNQLAVHGNADGSVLIGIGSDVAVSTYRLGDLSDAIFASGFESATP